MISTLYDNSKPMRKITFYFICPVVYFLCSSLYGQTDIDLLIKDFTSNDWKLVKEAKAKLENYEAQAIPKLIPLLEKNEIVKLINTGSLIYPGAEKFFGYGQVVDYDIDNIAIRTGWLLEDISFNNFGFSGCHLAPDDLLNFIKVTFPDYYNNSNNRKKLDTITEAELGNTIFKLSVLSAKDWWAKENANWTRLQALINALKSFDEKRQVKALFYMRNGDSRCSGLTKDYYIDYISKEIVRLSSSDTQRVSEHARLILFDTKFLWLENKYTPL
jgi:hypothetical protein